MWGFWPRGVSWPSTGASPHSHLLASCRGADRWRDPPMRPLLLVVALLALAAQLPGFARAVQQATPVELCGKHTAPGSCLS